MKTLPQTAKPWDARLAFRLVYPLRDTRIQPNHLTTLRLVFGLCASLLFSFGGAVLGLIASIAFMISNFLDHADGELARLKNSTSRVGHYYDLTCDAIINIFLFIGIAVGLSDNDPGHHALMLGVLAGLSVSCIFHLRHLIEQMIGKDDARQPHFAGFEAEDILYLLPLVVLVDGLSMFLLAAAIGAPCFAVLVIHQYLTVKRATT